LTVTDTPVPTPSPPPPPADGSTSDGLVLPIVVYVLYLIGLMNGLTALVGVIIAYVTRPTATPEAQSHLTFQIYTFWLGLVGFVISGLVIGVGFVLSFIVIGIPILILGWVMLGLVYVWLAVRCIVGLVRAAQNQPYPTPTGMVI
jgi:uncharacterized membrane protein